MRRPTSLLVPLVLCSCSAESPTNEHAVDVHRPAEQARITLDVTFPTETQAARQDRTSAPAKMLGQQEALRRTDFAVRGTLAVSAKRSGLDATTVDLIQGAFKARVDVHAWSSKVTSVTLWHDGDTPVGIHMRSDKPLTAVFYRGQHGDHGWYDLDGYRTDEGPIVMRPLPFSRVTSPFGSRMHPIDKQTRKHSGVDYGAPAGTPVFAIADGTVVAATKGASAGNYLVVEHAAGERTRYMHLKAFSPRIRRGSHVKQGDTIGYVGSTGAATGPHLHFEYLRSRWPVDPLRPMRPGGIPLGPIGKAELMVTAGLLK